jgi:hypothetical protein
MTRDFVLFSRHVNSFHHLPEFQNRPGPLRVDLVSYIVTSAFVKKSGTNLLETSLKVSLKMHFARLKEAAEAVDLISTFDAVISLILLWKMNPL